MPTTTSNNRKICRQEIFLVSFTCPPCLVFCLFFSFFGGEVCSILCVALWWGRSREKDKKKKGFPLHDRCLLFILLTCHRLIQHVMSGRSSHSYNSPFCYVLLCVCVCSFALSRTPARHEADVRPAPVRTYRHTRLHIHQHRYQTCLFCLFFSSSSWFFFVLHWRKDQTEKGRKKNKNKQKIGIFSFYRFVVVVAALCRLLYYNEMPFGVVGNVSNWSPDERRRGGQPLRSINERELICVAAAAVAFIYFLFFALCGFSWFLFPSLHTP